MAFRLSVLLKPLIPTRLPEIHPQIILLPAQAENPAPKSRSLLSSSPRLPLHPQTSTHIHRFVTNLYLTHQNSPPARGFSIDGPEQKAFSALLLNLEISDFLITAYIMALQNTPDGVTIGRLAN